MSLRSSFSADEWAAVTGAPALAATAVAAAERGGTLRESVALAQTYQRAARDSPGELVRELLGSPPTMDPVQANDADELAQRAAERVRTALAAVHAHVDTREADEYRRFIAEVAATVARAHKEGGFLGFGGKQVSEREQAVIDRIEGVLDEPVGA
jgi:xanthine dehydrogenase iron-sulfur cluster and FAD-binding subunit A